MNSQNKSKDKPQETTEHVHGPHCNHGHHHEKSEPLVNTEPKVGRNDPCSCGSLKKFKKCCGK